jgi:hypothetical protein
MSLQELIEKHRREGFPTIPVPEQLQMIRSSLKQGGMDLMLLNTKVAEYFNVKENRPWGHYECKPYFKISRQDAENYVQNHFEEIFAVRDAARMVTSDGYWISRQSDDNYTFFGSERGAILYEEHNKTKQDVIRDLATLFSKAFPLNC